MAEMEAIPVSLPHMTTVLNPVTLNEDEHLGYEAEIQYKRKEPTVRLIMCSSLDTVELGEPVMITYHSGMVVINTVATFLYQTVTIVLEVFITLMVRKHDARQKTNRSTD